MTKLYTVKIGAISFLFILAYILYEVLGIDRAKQLSDHLLVFLVIEIALGFILAISFYFNYFRYKRPKWFWERVIAKFKNRQIKGRFSRICEREIEGEQQTMLVEIALNNISSTERGKKMSGIEQLYHLDDEADVIDHTEYIYLSLLDILKTESDGLCTKIMVEAVCHFHERLYS